MNPTCRPHQALPGGRSCEPRGVGSCPSCHGAGKPIQEVTLRALLRGPALERRAEGEHRFCPALDCPVVYYGVAETFTTEDLSVSVFQKEPPGRRIVCYCLDIPEPAPRVEPAEEERTLHRVRALVKSGRCACELRNPQGSCCLGNFAALARARDGRSAPSATGVEAHIDSTDIMTVSRSVK